MFQDPSHKAMENKRIIRRLIEFGYDKDEIESAMKEYGVCLILYITPHKFVKQ